jgi:hypothetical protein
MATQGLMYPQEASGLEWNPQAIGARNTMTDWYQQVLAEARKVDPAATLNPQAGNASITVKGQQIPLTNVMKSDQDVYGITPAQMIQQKLQGGLMNMTPEQNQTVFNMQLAAMNQTPTTAAAAYYGAQPPVNGVYSAPHFTVGATDYSVKPGTGPQSGQMVQAGPQSFVPTAPYGSAPGGGSVLVPGGAAAPPADPGPPNVNIPRDDARESAQVGPYGTKQPGVGGSYLYKQPGFPTASAPYGAATGGYGPSPAASQPATAPVAASKQPSLTRPGKQGGFGTYGAGSAANAGTAGTGNTFSQPMGGPQRRQFSYKPTQASPSRSAFGGS